MSKPLVIIYVRLSRDSDASVSVESQIATCRAYADARGWEVLFIAEDVDVSGASRLEDREGMAKVLAHMPRVAYVLAAKLDRYARSVLEFSRLLKAGDDTGATLVTADGTLAPETSRLIVHVLSAFAEYERDMIRTRVLENKAKLRTKGRWLGGAAPYGYRIIRRDGGAFLDIDPESEAIIRECVRRVLEDGESLTGLAHDLNTRAVPSPADFTRLRDGREAKKTKWSTTTLREVMTSPALRGWLLQADPSGDTRRKTKTLRPVLDDNGEPQQVGPELLEADTFAAINSKLAARSRGAGVERSGKSVLLHVARCSVCGDLMYRQQRTARGSDFALYICGTGAKRGGHKGNGIKAKGLESVVEAEFLKVLGRFDLMREALTGGRNVAQELRETESAIEHLAANLAYLAPDGHAAGVALRQLAALETKLKGLQAEAAIPVGVTYVPTGRTIAEEWKRRGTAGRNELLRDFRVSVTVSPYVPGTPRRFDPSRVRVEINGPAWWAESPELAEFEDAA